MARRRLRRGRSHYQSERTICDARSELLRTINGFYAAALDRLPVDEMPALVPRLLKAGLCIGFSDPVTNIVVNTVSFSSRSNRVPAEHNSADDATKKKKRRRQKALSRAVADTSSVNRWPPYRPLLRDMPVAARSLEALVAFLTYSFRYLPVSEALQYLRLAKADRRAAVRLIEEDRNSGGSFSLASPTTKTALKCAALTAWHPKPRALVKRSYSLASRMEEEEVSQLLVAGGGCLSCSAIETINRLLKRRRKIRGLAGFTLPQFNHGQPPFVTTKSLKSVLLDKIYGLYIDALAQVPQDLLRQRYHRGLLIAGHCYGPLKNPVSNIVLNAVWYETMFPPQDELSVTMICSRSLVRAACRSLRGLVAYIRASLNTISRHQAMRYLLLTEVDLWEAIKMARREGHAENTLTDQDSAYEAAATAAMHPDPDAVVKFLVSTYPSMPISMHTEPFVWDVQLLSQMLLQHCSIHGSVQAVPAALSDGGTRVLSYIQRDFEEEERFVFAKVNAALKKYAQQTGVPEYEIHVICGLNSNVVNSYVFGLHYGPGHMRPRKSQYSHINFLASQRDLQSSDAVPKLFFAECSNKEDAIDDSSCWPVMGHPGRCFSCENEGAKIFHPDMTKYNGRDIEFERMACEHLGGKTVDDTGNRLITDSLDVCEEDCIYFDASKDVKCAEFLNARAMIFERCTLV